MPDRFSLVRWRPVTDPPKGNQDRQVWVQPADGSAPCAVGAWMVVAKPESFSRWCDPRPPGDDALTVTDLHAAVAFLGMFREDRNRAGDHRRVNVCDRLVFAIGRAIEEAER